MIVAITGTPGTGKTTVGEELAGLTGFELVKLNELADKKGLHSGYDEERECKIVDIVGLEKEVRKLREKGRNMIIESHYSHDMPADLVIVLRSNPDEIRRRGKEKGWGHTKTEENVVAEIMEECKTGSLEQGKTTFEVDTTGKTPAQSADDAAQVMQDAGMWLVSDVRIPEHLRDKLREPYGELFKDEKRAIAAMRGSDIISVGDYVTHSLVSAGTKPNVFVFDGKVRRQPFGKKIGLEYDTLSARNEPGRMTTSLWGAVKKALMSGKEVGISVEGEEDMAALPAVLLADNGSSVIYGLHGKGVCVIRVDDDAKRLARNVLQMISASQ